MQPYTINSAKVIFLNQRAQTRSCKGPANSCFTCDRILQEPFHFCSLSCKVKLHPNIFFRTTTTLWNDMTFVNCELWSVKCKLYCVVVFWSLNLSFMYLSFYGTRLITWCIKVKICPPFYVDLMWLILHSHNSKDFVWIVLMSMILVKSLQTPFSKTLIIISLKILQDLIQEHHRINQIMKERRRKTMIFFLNSFPLVVEERVHLNDHRFLKYCMCMFLYVTLNIIIIRYVILLFLIIM